MAELEKHKLSELGTIITGKTPKTSNHHYFGGKIPFITPSDDMDNKRVIKTARYLTEEGATSVRNCLLPPDSICVSCIGSDLGKVVLTAEPSVTNQQINSIIVDKNKFDVDFLYYALSQLGKELKIMSKASTATPIINKSEFSQYDIFCPDFVEQKKLGALLSLLDEKIDNNNIVSSTLEETAKTLYDYWFTQFDFPNEEGKPYRSSGGKMVWNEELKREIPEGWEVSSLKECIEHIKTGLNPRQNFVLGNGDIKYITVKNLTTSGTIDWTGCDVIDDRARAKVHTRSQISKGDILFASIAPLGRCVLIEEQPQTWDINESVFSIRANTKKVSPEFLYLLFMSDMFIKKAEHNSTGSVFNGIRINTLEDFLLAIPPKTIMSKFTSVVSSLLICKYKNEEESTRLAAIRDYLLPLLMNGQVTIED